MPVPQAEAAVGAQIAAAVVEQRGARDDGSPGRRAAVDRIPALPDFALAAAIPVYADRLIE